ncbi:unnamed protein product [Protopolystoma xenopodis]|uniref:Uncharacterized protein n=1 Tax=Protopolystoma xenopodis TaxID=117903 RepID=A0A3S5CVR5_9PLAT|nr:unnamed protein product [Protopolystoma xenopodis]
MAWHGFDLTATWRGVLEGYSLVLLVDLGWPAQASGEMIDCISLQLQMSAEHGWTGPACLALETCGYIQAFTGFMGSLVSILFCHVPFVALMLRVSACMSPSQLTKAGLTATEPAWEKEIPAQCRSKRE